MRTQQQEQLIQSLKAQVTQLERDVAANARARLEREHIDREWQQEREAYEHRIAQVQYMSCHGVQYTSFA
jgi:hypothetical protein